MKLENVIKAPLITEKSSIGADKYNRYGFRVDTKANKYQIKQAVESLYDVKVTNVKTNITPGKLKRLGRMVKKTPKVKKAYVQLAEGQSIEFFKGV